MLRISPESVVLYTARGCHLCEQARAVLDAEAVEQYDGSAVRQRQLRLWPHVGSAPSSIRIKSTIRIVEMEIISALLQEKC